MDQCNVGLIIQARTSSKRLPKKLLRPVKGDITFLHILLSRLNVLRGNLPIILATTTQAIDDSIVEIAQSFQLPFYRGSQFNVMDRFIQAATLFHFDAIIRVCADNPFIDIDCILDLLKEYNGEDYLSYSIDNTPSILTHYGFFAEIVSLKALRDLEQERDHDCIEHVTNCIYLNTDNRFNVRLIPLAGLNPNIRCTLDTKADFGILSRIYLEWYLKSNTESSYLELIRFIESDSDLVDTMKDQIEKHPKQV